MKKFFEKHDLFKLTGLFVLIAVLLTWLCSYSYYADGTITTTEITRIGIFDLSTYALLGFFYFTVIFVFIFIAAGFYNFLGGTDAYQRLTEIIADKFKGKEKIFVAISTLLFACLAGISTEYFVLLALVPFAITILSKLRVEKVIGLVATFGGILVGIIGSTYSTKIVGQLTNAQNGLGISYGYELISVIILFAITYLLLMFFAFSKMNKVNEENLLVDPFAKEENTENKKAKKVKAAKVNSIPLAIVMVISLLIIVLAFIGWSTALGVTVFTDVHNWLTTATVFKQPIFSYLLGGQYFSEFGNWDLLSAACILFIATLIIKIIYHISFDEVIEGYGKGFKKISKSVIILLMVYTVVELSYFYPVIPGLVAMIMKLGNNIFTLFASGLLTSLFVPDFQITVGLVGSLFKNFENVNAAALALQSAFGVMGFIAPTSAVLMLGLSMLDIKFKDWFKFIWKFILALFVVVCIVLAILVYV